MEFKVSTICRVLGVRAQGNYAWRKKVDLDASYIFLVAEIKDVMKDSRHTFGIKQVTRAEGPRIPRERDAPPRTQYRVPAPQAIAAVKKVLKTFYHGRYRWRVNYDDRQTGEIQASMMLIDDSYTDMRWLVPTGRVEKTINAHISIIARPQSVSELHIDWVVDAPISRSDCKSFALSPFYRGVVQAIHLRWNLINRAAISMSLTPSFQPRNQ